tara:strand:+ start:631 stop:957 length:327 start_codon:yes stop_codon:yes gene_type:complete
MAYYTNKITPEGTTKEEIKGEELTKLEAEIVDWNSKANDRKLSFIKQLRKEHLESTDWWVMRGSMTDAQTQYRQKLRDIPADYNSSKYDELLATDDNGNLTHSVWSKP